MQQPESKRRDWQPFCNRCTEADEEILVSASPKYLKISKDNPNDVVLQNRNPFPVYFKSCASNMSAFIPQPVTGRISPLGNTTITITFYAPATAIRHHEEVIILISQRPFFLPEGNACRFCFKPHDVEETEHIGENTERTSQELTDFQKKTTFTCKHRNNQIQATKDVKQKREGSNIERTELDTTFIEVEKEIKLRQVCHHHTYKVHQRDKQKTLPVHSSYHSEMVCLCLSADDIQSQKFSFSGDDCKECSGTKVPTRHIDSDEVKQQYQYKFFPMHSSISEQAPAVCRCTATERTKTQDAVFRDCRKSHSVKHDAGVDDDKKQTRFHGAKDEKKVVTDSPGNVQDSDGSNCYCNKRAHIQVRIVKVKDNNAVADEDSSMISSEDSKIEKRTRIISERVIPKHESRNKSHSVKHDTGVDDDKKQTRYHGVKDEKNVVTDSPRNVQDSDGSSFYRNERAHIQVRIVEVRDNNAVADEDSTTTSSEDTKREKRTRIISERVLTKHEKIKKEQKDSFESATGWKLSNEEPSRHQGKINAMILALDEKGTKILSMSRLTFIMVSLLMTIALGVAYFQT